MNTKGLPRKKEIGICESASFDPTWCLKNIIGRGLNAFVGDKSSLHSKLML